MENQPQPLSVTDLAVIKNIIDISCERGTFKAAEMRTVGEVYERLSAFLAWVVQQAENQSQANPQGETNA